MTSDTPVTLTDAARALRAIPSEARSETSRRNGRRGGRPVGPRVTLERAAEIVAEEFAAAGQTGSDVPVVSSGRGEALLSDGVWSEPLRRTEGGLRSQCQCWIAAIS